MFVTYFLSLFDEHNNINIPIHLNITAKFNYTLYVYILFDIQHASFPISLIIFYVFERERMREHVQAGARREGGTEDVKQSLH